MKRMLAVVAFAACSHGAPPATREACALEAAPVVVHTDGTAQLVRWDVAARAVFFTEALPTDAGYRRFRDVIRADGAELRVPIADRAPPADADAAELWRREDHNAALVLEGRAGTLRPIHCLEALLFAHQHARVDELTDPTEFVATILRKDDRLRIYLGAGDQLFPPKSVYGFDQAALDLADGWQPIALLHNHTVVQRGERHALGTPTLSASDVALFRGKLADFAGAAAWVTNGVFTAEIPASDLDQFLDR